MYVIKLGNSENTPFLKIKFSNLAAAAIYANNLNTESYDRFTVGVLSPSEQELDKFEDEFTSKFKHASELFFMEKLAIVTESDTDFDIEYKDNEEAETLIRNFYRNYQANLRLSPRDMISETMVFKLENVPLIGKIISVVYYQVPNTQTMVCNLSMVSGANVAGVSYKATGEANAKFAAYENAITNLLKVVL